MQIFLGANADQLKVVFSVGVETMRFSNMSVEDWLNCRKFRIKHENLIHQIAPFDLRNIFICKKRQHIIYY